MKSLLRCESSIYHFAQTERTLRAVKYFLPTIREAVKILEVPHEITKMLQKPDCSLSDFFGELIIMKEKLVLLSAKANKKTNLASHLIEQYERRKKNLLDNEAMVSAAFLDRRYGSKLNADQTAFAKLSLCKLWDRVCKKQSKDTQTNADRTLDVANDSFNFDDFDIEMFLSSSSCTPSIPASDSQMREVPQTVQSESDFRKTKEEFMVLLNNFEKDFPRIHHKTNMKTFWQEKKYKYPEIHVLAMILNAIPPAQASVERVFSTVAFVFDKGRSRLDELVLQNILLIKLNIEKLETIFDNDVEKLKIEYIEMEQQK